MKLALIIIGILGLLIFGAYQKTLHKSAALCVISSENANGESEDDRYLLRFGDGVSPGVLRRATREEYSERNPGGPIWCDASYSYTVYEANVSHYMALNGGFFTVINNGSRNLNRLTIGFGDTTANSLVNALEKMTEYDQGWMEAQHGYNVMEQGPF